MGNKEAHIHQEEIREYCLNKEEFYVIDDFFEELEHEGSAIRFASNLYYVSEELYEGALVACLDDREGLLRVIGNSRAAGRMKTDIEVQLEEVLMDKVYLRTNRYLKAITTRM